MAFSRIVTLSSANSKRGRAGGDGAIPGPRVSSAGGIECGLVMELPTKRTRFGPKLPRTKRSKAKQKQCKKIFHCRSIYVILDDDDDDGDGDGEIFS